MPATFHMCSSHNIRFKPQWLCTTQVGRMMSRLHQANISIGSAQAEAQVKCKLEALQRIASFHLQQTVRIRHDLLPNKDWTGRDLSRYGG